MNLRLLLSSASVAAVVLHAASASAITIASGYPQRIDAAGRIAPPAGTVPNPNTDVNTGINRADCFNTDQRWRFSIFDVPADATTVEIWARTTQGTCSGAGDRTSVSGSLPQCFKVVSWQREEVVNRFPEIGNLPIIQAADKRISVDDPASLTPAEVCSKDASMPPTIVYLHVMAFRGPDVIGGATGGTGTGTGTGGAQEFVYQTLYDIAGPNPPTGLTLGSGEQILVAKWDAIAVPASDFQGYRLFCYRGVPTTEPATSGGALGTKEVDGGLDADPDALVDDTSVDDASVDDADPDAGDEDAATTGDGGSGALPANCPAGVPFAPGEVPAGDLTSVPGVTECANTGTGTGQVTIENLEDNVAYAVIVTAKDKQGNSGVASSVMCAMPKSTNSFFDNYNDAGGRAGGGYCTFGASRVAPGGFALVLGLGLAGRLLRRRTRRSR